MIKVVLKENGRVYEALRAFNIIDGILDPRTNTIRIKNEYGKETFVYPKEIDWEATKKLNKEEQNNGKAMEIGRRFSRGGQYT